MSDAAWHAVGHRERHRRALRDVRTEAPSAHVLVWVAGSLGLLHAAASLYWAVGGRWLLATVGQWAVDLSDRAPLSAGIVLGLIALMKAVAAAIPIGVVYGRLPRATFWRTASWAAGVLLIVYGGVHTTVSAAVLSGLIRPAGGYDLEAMRGHAYLWGPLFLVWGTALVLSLWLSRRRLAGTRWASQHPRSPYR
ncbi:DUF3995 domain-containing protein [Blastococcus sp. SYSU DS1021]